MAILGSSDVLLKIQSTFDDNGVDAAESGLSGLGNRGSASVVGLTGSIFKAQVALEALKFGADLAIGAFQKLYDVGSWAVGLAASHEQSAVAFEVMLGSADKARKLLKDVAEFAKKTPFELPELIDTTKRLLAYNIANEDIIPTLTNLGNITAGIGRDKMPQLVLAYGQVRAATKLTGAELRQFTEAGVPLIDTLAKQFKVTEGRILEMVSAGQIGFPDVEKAFASMSGEGGKFFGLMERQSLTYDGTISNLRDNFSQMAMEIIGVSNDGTIRDGSVFQTLSLKAQEMLKWVDANRGGLEQWGKQLMDGLVTVLQNHVFPKLQQFGDWLTNPKYAEERQRWIDKMNEFAGSIGRAATDGGRLIGWAKDAKDWFDKVATGADKVAGALNSITNSGSELRKFIQGNDFVEGIMKGLAPGVFSGFATGTSFAPGGMALVGERGPELVNLPRGSKVTTAQQTAAALQGQGQTINFNHYGDVRSELDMKGLMSSFGWKLSIS